jgi:MFS family permease
MGPLAAVVADRVGGRRMLIGTQVLSAVIAAGMAVLQFFGHLSEGLLLTGAMGLGLAFTFALPVQTALVPRLVAEADTEAAVMMSSISYNAGRAAAPVLCVLLVTSSAGFAAAFGLNAASFLCYAVLLWKTRLREKPRSAPRARLWTGVRIARQQPRILLMLAIVAAVTLADDPILVLGPAVARQLNATSGWAGYFLSALGCGTMLGVIWAPADPARSQPRKASRRAAGWLVVLVVCMAVFVVSPSKYLALAAAFLAGTAGLRAGTVAQTQLARPGRQRSEAEAASIMALWAIAWAGPKPLASITDGMLANSPAGVLGAGLMLAVPALVLAIAEICMPPGWRAKLVKRARKWARRVAEEPAHASVSTAGT